MTAVHLAPHFICICNLREDICILFWHILVDVNHLDAKLPFPSSKTSLTQFFSAEGHTATASRCVKTQSIIQDDKLFFADKTTQL